MNIEHEQCAKAAEEAPGVPKASPPLLLTLKNPERLSTAEQEALFKGIWERYPSRIGRGLALRYFCGSVKSEDAWWKIQMALDHYLVCDRVQRGYVMNGSTWFNNWQDWVEPTEAMMRDLRNNGKTEQQQQQEQRRRLEELKRVREHRETT